MERAWLTYSTGQRGRGAAIVEYLTDERALQRIEAGETLVPASGTAELVAKIFGEISAESLDAVAP